MSLFQSFNSLSVKPFETTWRSPSNIAFVKYWGKKGHQLPANPSVSMTLKECFTETIVKFTPSESLKVDLYLDGNHEEKFSKKIENYLLSLSDIPCLINLSFDIRTKNTFPHGTGIASSASGLSAFALCLTDYLYELSGNSREDFYRVASSLSRLASGSACRSVYGGFATWGASDLSATSDEYASVLEVHPSMAHLRDSVLVVSGEEKKISSTKGHGRMSEHPFADSRFVQAKTNFNKMISALKTGDMDLMGQVLEAEALSLHAMMMTSPEPYTLFKPNSLTAMEMVWAFRRETGIPLYFTLDAGPNLHLIYPESVQSKVKTFISHELSPLAIRVIDDERGEGPLKC